MKMKARLDTLDLNFKYFESLMLLLSDDGQSQRALGHALNIPEYQVSRNLDSMEKSGLVERRPCPTSRRTTLVFLTRKGKEIAGDLPSQVREINAKFLEALSSDEQEQVLALLQKIHDSTD